MLLYLLFTHDCRRGKDYSRPLGFVSAGVQGSSKGGEEEGGSESEEEVRYSEQLKNYSIDKTLFMNPWPQIFELHILALPKYYFILAQFKVITEKNLSKPSESV